ncbi:MAG TPA: hypothetical protein VE244_12280 [Nitrososphaeraceae archaeon]|jgi:hypothetical protein|nr:hypothetical protein [Nitrososphaeraceae archaeon]
MASSSFDPHILVGAAISSFLISQLTAAWQVNEKEIALKYRLA